MKPIFNLRVDLI